ncbi:hypothetical protein KAX06_01280 [candidate division WOR-3 bacterium]|nr:hypothetical protein [candidate division WOR-3 bacterium]
MALWLGFNSWYRSQYSDLGKNDRSLIDKMKSDFTGRNHIYTRFCDLMAIASIKENLRFKSNLESLHYTLNRASTKYPDGYYNYPITFEYALFAYKNRKVTTGYKNLIRTKGQHDKIKLDEIYITDDNEKIFPCLLEIIYQIRCYLFHGDIEPSSENHEVVKYCYFILWDLMN